ncbi:MAG TPA: MFS transporter, partial [Roseiflexaceae bacterium]|nr:MFS transporter [Roseiflexaceae bacterium]
LTFGARLPFRRSDHAGGLALFELSVLPAAAAVLFVFLAYGGITTFVPLFAAAISVNSGLFFLAYAATLFLTRPIAGRLSDRYGETFILVPSLALTILALVTLAFSNGLWGVILAAVLYGIGFGSAMPVLQAITLRLARPDRIGVANASFATATDLGIGLGAMALGWVAQRTNYQVVFLVSAVSVALGLATVLLAVRRALAHSDGTALQHDSLAKVQ